MDEENNKILISWTAKEFIKKDKNRAWFAVLGILALALFVVGILMKNYIFSIIIVLSAFLIFIQALRHPQKIKAEIFEDHIVINDFLKVTFKEIKSFWIFEEPHEEPHFNTLSLETNRLSRPRIYLPLGQEMPDKIRQILTKFIPEKKQEESLIDMLAKKISF